MTVLADRSRMSSAEVVRGRPSPARTLRLPPSWPITFLLVGFPVLWALGLAAFATQILAIPMAIELIRRRRVKVPTGFGIWLVFLVTSLLGLFVLGVNPPDTVPNSFVVRLIGYAVRESSYLAITIVFLYVGNLTEKELPEKRVIGQLAFFFVTVTLGGMLGLLWPNVSFTSVVELFVPDSIRIVPYVSRLVHPAFSQLQEFGGDLLPRPSAPFAYTNTWGSQLSLLGIWFCVAWLTRFSRTQRTLGLVVGVAAVIALVYSLNRGVWLGVVLGIVFVVVLLAIRGRFVPLVGLLIAVAIGAQLFLHSPLKQVFQTRADNGVSNDIRVFTTKRAFELGGESPLIGFGTTRSAIGSQTSITVGRTPTCPTCGNVSIGINGSFFTLLVTTGYAGMLLFFGFWAQQAWQSRRDRSLIGVACVLTLLTAVFYSFFYTIELTVPFIALALMWRRRMARRVVDERARSPRRGGRMRLAVPRGGLRDRATSHSR